MHVELRGLALRELRLRERWPRINFVEKRYNFDKNASPATKLLTLLQTWKNMAVEIRKRLCLQFCACNFETINSVRRHTLATL